MFVALPRVLVHQIYIMATEKLKIIIQKKEIEWLCLLFLVVYFSG